jgi:Lecithin retinol acyltransferase
LGAHLVTPRLAFAHHGIYVGGGYVVHYGALARQFRRVPVEEVSLAFFAQGHAVYIRPHSAPRFDRQEVIRRARSRLGENRYGLLRNNCEHFCEWCVQGIARSLQVERALTFPRAVRRTLRATFALLHITPAACWQACARMTRSPPREQQVTV